MSALTREALAAITLFANLNANDLDRLLDRHRQSDHQIDHVIVMEQD